MYLSQSCTAMNVVLTCFLLLYFYPLVKNCASDARKRTLLPSIANGGLFNGGEQHERQWFCFFLLRKPRETLSIPGGISPRHAPGLGGFHDHLFKSI